MKLKYNSGGEVQEIPLSTVKPEGKRLAVHHDDQNFYAPLVDAGDATASNLRTVFKGEVLAVRQMPAPEIENILIAPPRVSVMQGQSATATVSAEGNEAVTGLSYSIANNPTWITIVEECILIQPSDNDLGEAIVEVIAKDTGSDASMSAAFVAEALLRPIISSLSIAPPAVTVAQGGTSTAIIEAVANSAVGGLSYSLDGAPSWVRNDNDTIWVEPTTNDSGSAIVGVIAYDPNSSARADTSFTAEAVKVPAIYGVIASPSTVEAMATYTDTVTLSADYNELVTNVTYSMTGAPSWMTLSGNLITCRPTANDIGTVTVTVTASDTGSDATASTELVVNAQAYGARIESITVNPAPQIKGSRVVAWQKNTLNYPLTCTANSAVTSVRYSLAPSENNPAWLSVYNYVSLRANPTTTNSALGDTATVTIVAYDTKSTAQATTTVNVSVIEKPSIGAIALSNATVWAAPKSPATVTVTAPNANSGVAGIEASLNADHPSWVSAVDDKIIVAPTATVSVDTVISVKAVDTGSTISSGTVNFKARARSVIPQISDISIGSTPSLKSDKIVGWKGSSLYYPLTCTANSAVTSVRYSLNGKPNWMSVTVNASTGSASLKISPSTTVSNAEFNVTIVASDSDTTSPAKATLPITGSVMAKPYISPVTVSPAAVSVWSGNPQTATVSVNANGSVESLQVSLANAPDWVTLRDNIIYFSPNDNDSVLGNQTISVVAQDSGSFIAQQKASVKVWHAPPPEIRDLRMNTTDLYFLKYHQEGGSSYLTSLNSNQAVTLKPYITKTRNVTHTWFHFKWAGDASSQRIADNSTNINATLAVHAPTAYNSSPDGALYYEPFTLTAYDEDSSAKATMSGLVTIDNRYVNAVESISNASPELQTGTGTVTDTFLITLRYADALRVQGDIPKGAKVTLSGGNSQYHTLKVQYDKAKQTLSNGSEGGLKIFSASTSKFRNDWSELNPEYEYGISRIYYRQLADANADTVNVHD